MALYVTFFSVGKGTESLCIDDFERSEELIIWESHEQYSSSGGDFSETVIDGGVFSYGIATGVAGVPDALIENRIVSFRAAPSLLFHLRRLDMIVR